MKRSILTAILLACCPALMALEFEQPKPPPKSFDDVRLAEMWPDERVPYFPDGKAQDFAWKYRYRTVFDEWCEGHMYAIYCPGWHTKTMRVEDMDEELKAQYPKDQAEILDLALGWPGWKGESNWLFVSDDVSTAGLVLMYEGEEWLAGGGGEKSCECEGGEE